MSIQSHSFSHRYLTALSPAELREELSRSKAEIEQHVGRPVTLLAPPGGRMPRGLGALARELGYRWVLSSQPGAIRRGASGAILPRMAVTAHLDEATLSAWLDGDGRAMLRARMRYAVLGRPQARARRPPLRKDAQPRARPQRGSVACWSSRSASRCCSSRSPISVIRLRSGSARACVRCRSPHATGSRASTCSSSRTTPRRSSRRNSPISPRSTIRATASRSTSRPTARPTRRSRWPKPRACACTRSPNAAASRPASATCCRA